MQQFTNVDTLKNIIKQVDALYAACQARSLKIKDVKEIALTILGMSGLPYDCRAGLFAVVSRRRTYKDVMESLRYTLTHLHMRLDMSELVARPAIALFLKRCEACRFSITVRGRRIYIKRPDGLEIYIGTDGKGQRSDVEEGCALVLETHRMFSEELELDKWEVIEALRMKGATLPEARRFVHQYGLACAVEMWEETRFKLSRAVNAIYKWAICPGCEGHGKCGNPAFMNGLSSSEWADMEPNEQAVDLGVVFDTTCHDCGGSGKVKLADVSKMNYAQKRELVRYRRELELDTQIRQEDAIARRMGH